MWSANQHDRSSLDSLCIDLCGCVACCRVSLGTSTTTYNCTSNLKSYLVPGTRYHAHLRVEFSFMINTHTRPADFPSNSTVLASIVLLV